MTYKNGSLSRTALVLAHAAAPTAPTAGEYEFYGLRVQPLFDLGDDTDPTQSANLFELTCARMGYDPGTKRASLTTARCSPPPKCRLPAGSSGQRRRTFDHATRLRPAPL